MKTIIAALLAGCTISIAQPTNVEPVTGKSVWPKDGRITDTNILIPFTCMGSFGVVVSNAIPARLYANKLIYVTTNGSGGTIRLEKLPPELQQRFRYNPTEAADADVAEAKQKTREAQVYQKQSELIQQQKQWGEVVKKATATKYLIRGRVIQKITPGLLVSWNFEIVGNVPIYRTILLQDYPRYESAASDDYIEASAMPIGQYSYTTVNKSENTIHAYTCSTNKAVEYYLTH